VPTIRRPERLRVGHEALVDEPHATGGVADEHVDPPPNPERALDEPLHVAIVGDVGLDRVDRAGELTRLGGHRRGLGEASRGADHDVGAGVRVRQRDRPADAPTTPGDDRHAFAQIHLVPCTGWPVCTRCERHFGRRSWWYCRGAVAPMLLTTGEETEHG
jgi:hypothetical protein